MSLSIRRRAEPRSLVLVLILGSTLFRLWLGQAIGLGFGESYHFSGALRPALSYFDHPPLTFWLGWLSMKVFGQAGHLVLRLPTILLFGGTTWLLYALGRRLFSPWAGFWAALLLNLSAVFTWSTATFLQPDGPLMFFWLACVLVLVKIFFGPPPKRPLAWWALAGLLLGLATLAKYHSIFIPAGIFVFILTQPDRRARLASAGPYLALALCLAAASPILVWNVQHDFVSFLFQGGRGAESSGLRLDWLARNILGQSLDILPWLFVPLTVELGRCLRAGRGDQKRWFLFWLAVWPIALFTLVSAYAPIGYHFHWQAPGWLLLFPPLGRTVEKALAAGRRWVRPWLVGSAVFTCLALALAVSQALTGWATPIFQALAPPRRVLQADPTRELLDWTPVEEELKAKGLWRKEGVFLFSNRWFSAGKLDYAVRGQMPVVCFSGDPRSFAFYARPEDFLGQDGILVVTQPYVYHPLMDFNLYFETIYPLGLAGVKRGGRVDMVVQFFYCRKLIKPFPLPY